MSVYKRGSATTYSYDFVRGGRRHSGTTGETERRAALAVERQRIAEAEEALKAVKRRPVSGLTLNDACDRYWDEMGSQGSNPKAVLKELAAMALLVGRDLAVTAITDEVVSTAVALRRKEFRWGDPKHGLVTPAQVNRSLAEPLRRVLTRARKVWKIALPDEPNWEQHALKEPKERVRELLYAEEDKLDGAEREDYRPARMFAQVTGLRRREVAGLRWCHINREAGSIGVTGKGDKPHTIPITAEIAAILDGCAGHHPEAVFTYLCRRTRRCPRSKREFAKGRRYPITYAGLGTHMKRAIKKAGIEGFRLHDLRHTAGTRTLRATGNLRLTQELLAHASPTTTAKYAHVMLDDMREGMEAASRDSERRRRGSHGTPHQSETGAAKP